MAELTTPSFLSMRRRQVLGTGGVLAGGAAGTLLDGYAAPAEAADASARLKEYFSILATGEALFVTFYSNAVNNHRALGLAGAELNALKAILTEEQIHSHAPIRSLGHGCSSPIRSEAGCRPDDRAWPGAALRTTVDHTLMR